MNRTLPFVLLFFLTATTLSALFITRFGPIDDHEVFEILGSDRALTFSEVSSLAQESLQTTGQNKRFRPLYYPTRFLEIFLFRDNVALWAISRFALAFFCVFIFWVMLRNHLPPWPSVLISLMPISGTHAEIWYMLGPSETQGFPLFLLGVLGMLWGFSGKKWAFHIGHAAFLLASLFKEAFIPVLGISVLSHGIWAFLSRTKPHLKWSELAVYGMVFVSEVVAVLLIVSYVGSFYASSFSLGLIFRSLTTWALSSFPVFLALILLGLSVKRDVWLRPTTITALLGLTMMMFSQVVIYHSGAMTSRYLLLLNFSVWGLVAFAWSLAGANLSAPRKKITTLLLIVGATMGCGRTFLASHYWVDKVGTYDQGYESSKKLLQEEPKRLVVFEVGDASDLEPFASTVNRLHLDVGSELSSCLIARNVSGEIGFQQTLKGQLESMASHEKPCPLQLPEDCLYIGFSVEPTTSAFCRDQLILWRTHSQKEVRTFLEKTVNRLLGPKVR